MSIHIMMQQDHSVPTKSGALVAYGSYLRSAPSPFPNTRSEPATSSLLKKPPGEGTGPTMHAFFRGNLVGRVPSRGEGHVVQQTATRAQPPYESAFSCASFNGNNEFMIENLIILARRLFEHKHRFARG